MKGYKAMLRDKVPSTWKKALIYCKALNKWIDLVYEQHLRNIPQKERSNIVKELCARKKRKMVTVFDPTWPWVNSSNIKEIKAKPVNWLATFHDTIKWEDLEEEELEYWITIEGWVRWFTSRWMYILNAYQVMLYKLTDKELEEWLVREYSLEGYKNLVNYLIKCLKNERFS